MINSVRNTVLAVANKQNFGYITPSDFNLYAKQAQLDLFEDYFYSYSQGLYKQNTRRTGSGYADIVKGLEEVIDSFSSINTPVDTAAPLFPLPLDYYLINVVRYGGKEVERVSNNKILQLASSNLTAPNVSFPAYVLNGNDITVYPDTILTGITLQYIRKPLDPKWTYASLSGGEPVFDQSNSDYQDFELPESDAPSLIAKILQYVGISIREKDVYQFGSNEEVMEQQTQG
jgi:hypothetical protein|tara:strand:+ start:884 stop:1576 length:693 start_codon:yes stop_codon:yes gene_type:complete